MKFLIIVLGMMASMGVMAQSPKCLPSAGDEYIRCAHVEKLEFFLTEPSASAFWDFGYLKTYYAITEKFEKASNGKYSKLFPGATMVWKKNNNEEEYLYVRDGGLYSLGKTVEMPYYRSKAEILRYEPARRILQTGLRKAQEIENKYTLHIKIAKKDVNLKLNFVPVQFDSIWLELSHSEKGEYTADGYVSLGGNSSQVVRMEYSILQNFRVKGKKAQGKWEAYDKLNGNALPPELTAYLRYLQYKRVDFLSPDYAGPMVSFEIMNNTIAKVDYQNRDVGNQVAQLAYSDLSIVAHPNPSFGPIVVDLFNYPFDDYTLEVYNIVGKRIFFRKYDPKDGRQLRADLTALKRGTYLYSIFDGKGRKIVTKRVSLISI